MGLCNFVCTHLLTIVTECEAITVSRRKRATMMKDICSRSMGNHVVEAIIMVAVKEKSDEDKTSARTRAGSLFAI